MIIYELHVAANTWQVLSLATQMHEQQGMYNTITENLDEGIIVKQSSSGLQYFNSKGFHFLQLAADLTGLNKTSCHAFLRSLNEKIQNFKELTLSDQNEEDF